MNGSLVRHMIAKDFRLHRELIIISTVVGFIGLAVVQFRGLTGLFGIIGFFTTLIVLACILPQASVVMDRKGQHLTFLMSLPISATQYTTAKMLSALGMFLIPWLTLVIGALSIILGSDIPDGLIPIALVLITLPLVGFCLMTSVALVGESEGWTVGVMIAINFAYSLCWPLIARNNELRSGFGSSTPVWSPTILTLLGSEFAVIAAALAITYYLQSRKRDFV
ncbi:MAG TPA: ABC-2 transporter permease [Terriglobia bacterium]|nr:ABC-2 transporter permease [Terriglobia bacterium]